jgi:hypothetical protein
MPHTGIGKNALCSFVKNGTIQAGKFLEHHQGVSHGK